MKIIVLGGGAACFSFIENLIELKQNKNNQVSIFAKEKYYPYYRPFLSKCCGIKNLDIDSFYLAKTKDPKNWFNENNININVDNEVKFVNFKEKFIYDSKDKKHYFDKLLIATGSHAFYLPNVDYTEKGIFKLISYDDVKEIENYVWKNKNIKKAVVIGGGILGCESAFALSRLGIYTEMIELMPTILPRMLPKNPSIYIKKIIESHNIKIYNNVKTKRIYKDENKFSIELDNNDKINCDLVIINIGVRPNIEFLNKEEIEINRGIICNKYLETSQKNVYAAGDIIEIKDYINPMLWDPAKDHGKIIANNMFLDKKIDFNVLKKYPILYSSFGINLICIGNSNFDPKNCKELIISNSKNKREKTFVYYKDKKLIYVASFNSPVMKKIINNISKSQDFSVKPFLDHNF